MSSRGASTSSNIQKGDGFAINTANNNEIAVKACSPPDNKVIFCIFLPGGLANISKPEFKGSSSFWISFRYALPPPNNLVNSLSKFSLTILKASFSLNTPSLLILLIASCNFSIDS